MTAREDLLAHLWKEVININLRTHVRFKGDSDQLGRTSSWSYFRVTK